MATIDADGKGKQAKGNAFILSIGKANPHNIMDQSTYPDYYFRITNSEHKTELKEKFKYICEASKIKKRYTHLTEEILKKNPSICSHMTTSLDARQDIIVMEVPKLGKEAAIKAMEEWSQPKSRITHLVFATTTGVGVPGADSQLTRLLGLSPSVKRYMMYQQGCFAGGAALRLAKDLAENNKGARVLVVCSEMTLSLFRAPSEDQLDSLVSQAIFGDGAAAVIVGSNPVPGVENPLFELVWTTQTILPDSEGALSFNLREVGLTFHFLKDIPELITKNVENNLAEAFQQLDITDWNSIFWVVHPGRSDLMDKIELKLGLKADKLRGTRHVHSEYGNMASASVLFILDEVRQKSVEDGLTTTGEGLEWGVLYCFGTGVTVDIVVLRSVAI